MAQKKTKEQIVQGFRDGTIDADEMLRRENAMKTANDLTHAQLVALVNQVRNAFYLPPGEVTGWLLGVLSDYGLAPEVEDAPTCPEQERLVELALDLLGGDSELLDDAVLDLAQEVGLGELNSLEGEDDQDDHITERERAGSEINAGGLNAQIAYLLEHNGPAEVERIIRKAAAGR